MILDELNKLIRDSINAITGIEAIKYYPNAPRMDSAFATVNILNINKVGGLSKQFIDNAQDVDEKIVMLQEAQISINFYKNNSRQNAALFSELLARNDIVEMFNAANAGVTRTSDIRDLTELYGHEHEERAQLDVFVQFELTPIPVTITSIESARVNGEIDNGVEIVDKIEIPKEDKIRILGGWTGNENCNP